ncbi:hypothetical protein MPTK1_1g26600 [Marchantia polymorpha subsp. ruderalis]|uniref:PsbP C-terminal domain-containing protein n=2 Tax=Marchantia polymorpha TaxID=3197 RepID=A0A176WLW7_MARPO|nr:hypothetical protein AXG93_4689s1060 [Marchantia polymorpha subsp. ruderalis]PTQ49760.1 hypothetical protein MARPO_0002s0218 [Marchantia polymorpha]BBN00124.1 hypothetical protein Mp_1g26600 [Marchantia polymorpha subsp. ruderalis]|eukprot:PTQ49760.1 hypothetical protein MARPO_0002s0218 [Marchantia polymorpha]
MSNYCLLSSRSSEVFALGVGPSAVCGVTGEYTRSVPSRVVVGCSAEDRWKARPHGGAVNRREAITQLGAGALAVTFLDRSAGRSAAVQQNQLPGRIPGLSDADEKGVRTYRRPDGKSGGHGVGWSPIIPYTFKVPTDWQEIPVSIADLGGTEIDLRFQSPSEGNISVIVAPVLRFSSELGDNVKIEDIGEPQKVIDAFGPEITGQNVEGKVRNMDVKKYGGRTYYQYELDVPHMLVTATAAGNRLYLLSVTANGRQWKKFAPDLRDIQDSFRVEA